MADGILVGDSGVSVNDTGAIVDADGTACCCTGCYTGDTCPSGLSGTYTVDHPASVSGTCTNISACTPGPSSSTVTATGGACAWDSTTGICFAGFTGNTGQIQLRMVGGGGLTCSVFQVKFIFGSGLFRAFLLYEKVMASSADTPPGTYTLVSTDCLGAGTLTADSTITVT